MNIEQDGLRQRVDAVPDAPRSRVDFLLAGEGQRGELELYLLWRDGTMTWRVDGTWRSESLFAPAMSENAALGGLVRLGPGRVLAASSSLLNVKRLEGGQWLEEPTGFVNGITSLARVAPDTIAAGTAIGDLGLRIDEAWTSIDFPERGNWVLSVVPLAGGWLLGAAFGIVRESPASGPPCGPSTPIGFSVDVIFEHPDGRFLFIGTPTQVQRVTYSWVTLTRR